VNSNPSSQHLLRALLLLMIAATFAASCGGDDDAADDAASGSEVEEVHDEEGSSGTDTTENETVATEPYDPESYAAEYNESEESWSDVGAEEAVHAATKPCEGADEDGRYHLKSDELDGAVIFGFSPAFRFHPSDNPNDGPGTTYETEPLKGSLTTDLGQRPVFVLDRGDHGTFITQIIHRQTGVKPERIEVGVRNQPVTDAELSNAINDVPHGSIVP